MATAGVKAEYRARKADGGDSTTPSTESPR
ncbi:hypothetical protein CCACVL1_19727 [Corchorus capsularis]|uniref:Uncharacterized protein n=1 Tax=Corchorus capsularis TaxID=210143 RepID=A0A1R3HFA0_COCAP|nr:hypothetical protein CCACVL1_19727 [Corchorus capsularis]